MSAVVVASVAVASWMMAVLLPVRNKLFLAIALLLNYMKMKVTVLSGYKAVGLWLSL